MHTDAQVEYLLKTIDGARERIIGFLQELVSVPSVTGSEGEIQQVIIKRLGKIGLHIDTWDLDEEELKTHSSYIKGKVAYAGRPNVVGIQRGTGGGRSLLFNGHVDVVPTGEESTWSHGPWSSALEDGKLYGRGSSDMKSGVAAMTMAMELLLETGFRPKGDVILEYTVDEEDSGNGTLACVQRGYRADAGICCETSSLHVQPACIGRIWFEIRVLGKPAGIQKHFEGVSAIDKAYRIVDAVKDFEAIRLQDVHHPLYPDIQSSIPCMVTVVQSGSFPSSFPDTAVLKGSMATVPQEKTAMVKQAFCDHLGRLFDSDPWLRDHRPEILFNGYCGDPAEIPVDHPVVTMLGESFKQVTGRDAPITGRQGAADIRYLIHYGHTPTVIFGPGRTEQMHASNEHVYVEEVITATKTLALAIFSWCGCDQDF